MRKARHRIDATFITINYVSYGAGGRNELFTRYFLRPGLLESLAKTQIPRQKINANNA